MTLMKAQKQIAMALTIVLTLAAGTLLVWHVSPPQTIDLAETSDVPEPVATPVATATELPELTVAPHTAKAANAATLQAGLTTPDCRFGFTQDYRADGSEGDRHCLKSAYWDYTTETLEQLVYADAEAARVLAHRLKDIDYPRALRLAMRSAALSGGDITALIEARYWRPMNHRNGDPDLSGIAQGYVLMSLADKIRAGQFNRPARFETRLRNLSDEPDVTLSRLDKLVKRLFDDVQEIELDVTGQSTIGGDDDA